MSKSKSRAIVVMAASAGGLQALSTVLGALDKGFPAAIVIVQHRPAGNESLLVSILQRCTKLPVMEASGGATPRSGTVYIARSDRHLTITGARRFHYSDGRRIRHVLSSAIPLFESAGAVFGPHAIGVVLTGTGCDATDGVQAVKRHGGTLIAQDEATSAFFSMPRSAIATGAVDYVLPLPDIAPALSRLVRRDAPTLGQGLSGHSDAESQANQIANGRNHADH